MIEFRRLAPLFGKSLILLSAARLGPIPPLFWKPLKNKGFLNSAASLSPSEREPPVEGALYREEKVTPAIAMEMI